MKVLFLVLPLLAVAVAKPAITRRIYFPEENDPLSKGFYPIETDGRMEMVPLSNFSLAQVTKAEAKDSDILYYLYTKDEQAPLRITDNDVGQLKESKFDPKKKTIVIAHGWTNNYESSVNRIVRKATLDSHDFNVLVVDWSAFSTMGYLSAKSYVLPIGKLVGNFINSIQETYNINGSSFVLVGHSLGAHVVGNAGAAIKNKVESIIGLDPAAILYSLGKTDERLDETDGKYVEVIHTSWLTFKSSIGHNDYYPNGGVDQPGCGIDVNCAHGRAYHYFAESIVRGKVFQSLACEDWDSYVSGLCKTTKNKISYMGQIDSDESNTDVGDFFLKTSSRAPFGLN